MATNEKALAKMRDIVSSLPDTSEGKHFTDIAFKAGSRMFATFGEKNGTATIVVAVKPEHFDALLAKDPAYTKYPRAKDAVAIDTARVRDWAEVKALVEESYAIVTAPKKKKPAAKKAATTKKKAAARRS